MRVCPLCQARFDDDVRKCPYDGRRPLAEDVITAASGDVLLGTTIADRYTIVGRVGAGGMGTVYRAEQAPIGREVALKVLRKDLGRDPETVARFHREAQTLSQLKHPNTVTIFDFGQTPDGLLYLAMELLEGEMLSSRLKRVGPLEVPIAIRTAAGVLRSLAEAHANGIIHRDLKPDNIYLAKVHGRPEEDEVVKVVDFGIAKIRDGARGLEPLQTQEGTVFGTPRYMSPEQAQGKSLDGRSDLYAVGVLLFHMLTGQAPFTDDDAVVVMAHHIKTVPPPVRTIAPARPIPASLEALVQRALEKDALNRPQSAEAFLVELERTAEDVRRLSLPSVPTTITVPPPRPGHAVLSRRAVIIGAAVLVLLGMMAGLASEAVRTRRGAGTGVASPSLMRSTVTPPSTSIDPPRGESVVPVLPAPSTVAAVPEPGTVEGVTPSLAAAEVPSGAPVPPIRGSAVPAPAAERPAPRATLPAAPPTSASTSSRTVRAGHPSHRRRTRTPYPRWEN